MGELDRLQEMHAQLARAKYFYYEKHESIMSDYEFDMMEKEYSDLADVLGIDKKHRITEVVGFGLAPRDLNNFYSLDNILTNSPQKENKQLKY